VTSSFGRAALRGIVLERQVAIDSVPLTREPDRDLLGDVERSVGMNGEERMKLRTRIEAGLRARINPEREDECADEEEWGALSSHD